ncbi:MAG: hypothetical protein ACYCO3_06370 [Mycobacteriales bacterium]
MYVWLWRRLPGGLLGKLAGSLVLFLLVVALLFYVIFPRVEGFMPWNHVTVRPAAPAAQRAQSH